MNSNAVGTPPELELLVLSRAVPSAPPERRGPLLYWREPEPVVARGVWGFEKNRGVVPHVVEG